MAIRPDLAGPRPRRRRPPPLIAGVELPGSPSCPDRVRDGDARRAARIGTAIAVVAFVLLATGGRPWELFVRGPFTSDFYDAQAYALSRGHLDVDPQVASIEGFVVEREDALLLRHRPGARPPPVRRAHRCLDGRLVVLSMAIGLTVGCLAAARLLQRARRALGVAVPARWWPWITGGFAAAVGLSSPLLWLSSRALVYHEAELWGAALALLGFERVVAWWSSRPRPRPRVGVRRRCPRPVDPRVVGDRPALALGGLAVVVAWRRAWRDAGLVVIAAAAPVALYALSTPCASGRRSPCRSIARC